MNLEREWITETWTALVAGSELEEGTTVLFVVDSDHDPAFVEAAYLPPTGFARDYRILGYLDDELAAAQSLHRFALFSRVADGPLQGFAAMLKHELRHGEQDRQWGGGLWELDGHLRAALGLHGPNGDRDAYRTLPTECDANRTAAAYVAHEDAEVRAALAADDRFRAYTERYAVPDQNVLEATLAAVNEHVDLEAEWNGAPTRIDVTAQYNRALADHARLEERDRYAVERVGPAIVYAG